ncbi:hypothetical protein D9M70_408320 [compost metagenome]
MAPDGHHLAPLHHRDTVGVLHRGQAVGDHQGGAAAHQGRQGLLDQMLAFRVQGTGGFIQQQDWGIHQQRASNGQALPLAAGQADTALPQMRLVALGQAGDELVGMGRAGCCFHFGVTGLGTAVADVVLDAAEEQRRILRYQGKASAQVGGVELIQLRTFHQDGALLRVEEAQQQLEHRRLASPRRPHQGQGLAGTHVQADAVQGVHFGAAGVGEAHPAQFDAAADPRRKRHPPLLRGTDGVARLEQLGDAFRRAGRALQFADHFADGTEGRPHDQAVENESRQVPGRDAPGYHVRAADPEHHPHGAEHQHDHQGDQPGTLGDAQPCGIEGAFHGAGEALAILRLVVVGLHGLDLPQGLTDIAADIGDTILALSRQASYPAAEDEDRCQHQRQRQQHDAGELGIGDEQQGYAADQHDAVAQRHGQG